MERVLSRSGGLSAFVTLHVSENRETHGETIAQGGALSL